MNIQSSSATTSPSSSTSQLSAAATPGPSSDCAGSNGTIYSSLFLNGLAGVVPSSAGLKFTKVCSTEQYGFNLALAYVSTFEACIELCASLNFWNQDRNCLGGAYKPIGGMPGNCWAHNVRNSMASTDFDSAVLIT